MVKIITKWDLLHLLATTMLTLGKWQVGFSTKTFISFMVILQVLWFSWLLVSRGHSTPHTRIYISAIRSLMSLIIVIISLLSLLLTKDSFIFVILPSSALCFVLFILIINFSILAAKEQDTLAPTSTNKFNRFIFIYINKNDKRIIVPRGPLGVGITFNFAHWETWSFLSLVIGIPLLMSIFK